MTGQPTMQLMAFLMHFIASHGCASILPRVPGNPLDTPGLADQSRPIPVGRPFLADPHHAMVRQECLTYLLDTPGLADQPRPSQ